jgi:3-methylfumaryl-CoA hydratase
MLAGGRVKVTGILRCGECAIRRSRVLSVEVKDGRSGSLTFCVVSHQILQRDQIVIDEQQDLVYREAAAPGRPPASSGGDPAMAADSDDWVIETSPSLLFRFSALTYNAHRIHYDRDYSRVVEGYPGLRVHGPLQALAMAEAARRAGGTDGRLFEYRVTSPLFDYQGMAVSATRNLAMTKTAVRDRTGRQTASGTLGKTTPNMGSEHIQGRKEWGREGGRV